MKLRIFEKALASIKDKGIFVGDSDLNIEHCLRCGWQEIYIVTSNLEHYKNTSIEISAFEQNGEPVCCVTHQTDTNSLERRVVQNWIIKDTIKNTATNAFMNEQVVI